MNDQWGISALIVLDEADAAPGFVMTAPAVTSPATFQSNAVPGLACTAWRFDFAVTQTAAPQQVACEINGQRLSFAVPAAGTAPNLVYASCNGFSDPAAMKKVAEPNALWARLGRLHALQDRVDSNTYGPFHLLLLGGDQVYSDAIWAVLPELQAWSQLDKPRRIKAPFTAAMQKSVQAYFSTMYLQRWSQPEVAAILAGIPGVLMGDDHDIMDGWGSHPADLHYCPVFQGFSALPKRLLSCFSDR